MLTGTPFFAVTIIGDPLRIWLVEKYTKLFARGESSVIYTLGSIHQPVDMLNPWASSHLESRHGISGTITLLYLTTSRIQPRSSLFRKGCSFTS